MTVQRRAARSPETPAAGGKPGPPASARDVRAPYDHTRAVMAARTIETLARSTLEHPSDDDLRAAHEILLLLRRLAGQGSGGADPDLDRWNWAAQALNAAATAALLVSPDCQTPVSRIVIALIVEVTKETMKTSITALRPC